MNKLQSLGRTENFILKLSIQFFKNSELRATQYQKNIVLLRTSFCADIDFSRAQLKPNDFDETGNEGAATQ